MVFALLMNPCVSGKVQPNISRAKQGYLMVMSFDNRGTFGRVSYPGVINGFDPGPDSVGLAYPLGQPYEHLFGGGIYVGGKLDTSRSGTAPQVTLVTTSYEGWTGPYFEFFPGSAPADTIWKVRGRGVQRPPSWDAYWGDAIPRVSISDNDDYCTYTDTSVRVSRHVPLRVKVVQGSFVWNDPYAATIQIGEYRVMNVGFKTIDSAYVAFFFDGSVGPYRVPQYYSHNYTGYYSDIRTAYVHNPIDFGSTPVGVMFLGAPRPLDSLRLAFRWYAGMAVPGTDPERYAPMSSGTIQPDEFPSLSDALCFLSCGPFAIHPQAGPDPDTLDFAFGILSGPSLSALRLSAERARVIYVNHGIPVSVDPTAAGLPVRTALLQNYPNPFNPATKIGFELSAAGFVSVKVFDVLGREVALLLHEEMPPGKHETKFNGANLSSGVYFCRLETRGFVDTRKIVLLR